MKKVEVEKDKISEKNKKKRIREIKKAIERFSNLALINRERDPEYAKECDIKVERLNEELEGLEE